MWNETKRQRFNELRERKRQSALTPDEKMELDALYHELEEMEAAYLRPASERKRQETEKLRAINAMLRDVIRRKEEHLARLKVSLAQFRAERDELDAELERILAQVETEGAS